MRPLMLIAGKKLEHSLMRPSMLVWVAAVNRLCVDSERLEHLPETLQGSFAVKIVC